MAEAQISLRADTSDAVEAFNRLADSAAKVIKGIATGSLADLSEVLGGPAEGVKKLGDAFVDVAKQIGAAVSAIAKMTGDSVTLGQRLGIDTSQAQALGTALREAGVSTDTYASAAQGMQTALGQNEAGWNKLGLTTSDANGHLLETTQLMDNGIEFLGKYQEGTERNTMAQQLFGTSAQQTAELMGLHKDAVKASKDELASLGLTITDVTKSRVDAYNTAVGKAKTVQDALTNQIGQSFMPAFTKMAQLSVGRWVQYWRW